MVKNVKDSDYKMSDKGILYTPTNKVVNPKGNLVNVIKNGKRTKRTILSLMIETFDLKDDTIQLRNNDDYSLNNLISIEELKKCYLRHIENVSRETLE